MCILLSCQLSDGMYLCFFFYPLAFHAVFICLPSSRVPIYRDMAIPTECSTQWSEILLVRVHLDHLSEIATGLPVAGYGQGRPDRSVGTPSQ